MEKTLVIIDGNSLINRAYYAMQRPMITREGLYTQGVYGFLNMLAKIRKDYKPGYIAVAFDLKAPTFRHKEYAEYKAGRKKMPPELAMQMPLLKDVLAAMNIRMLEMEGFEADDIIGTVARQAEEEGLSPLIITGDKDELQLATDVTRVLITRRGISEFEIYDKNAMIEKYGFTPTQFIDFKGLMGDQSDNIPGVPGIGEKTAQKLILEFGSVENLIENIDTLKKSKMKENIEENSQLAMMSKRLATINVNVPIDFELSEMRECEPDYDKLIEVYKKLEFNSFLKKLDRNVTTESETAPVGVAGDGAPAIPDEKSIETEMISTESDFSKLEKMLASGGEVSLKVLSNHDHKGSLEIYGIGFLSGKKFLYVKSDACMGNREKLASVLNSSKASFTGHDLKDDYFALMNLGVRNFNTGFDSAIAQYVLNSSRSGYDIKSMASEYYHADIENEKDFYSDNGQVDLFSDNTETYASYARRWCAVSQGLMSVLKAQIEEDEAEKVLYEVELPLIEVMAGMEAEGFTVDEKVLASIGSVLDERIAELTASIYGLAGEEFNIKSPAQLGPILFEKLGLPAGKKTKKGYSTSAEVLEKLKDKHEIVPCILEYRMLTKLKGTYVDGLIPLIGTDGKIRAHFQQTVAATGRISCTEPNLQNIPVRNDFGRRIRKAFVPQEGCVLVGADYSQIELRVLAHMSCDEQLIEAFNKGADIHKLTAAKVLGIPEEEITPLQRSRAKAVNFGVIYGMSSFGLSTEIHVTRKEADQYIKDYFEKYSMVKRFMDEQIEFAKAQGYVKTLMGRKRYINEITAGNYMVRQLGERLAMNSPIQGSAADIIKLAMIKVHAELKKRNLKSRLILQVHDELIIETRNDEIDEVKKLLVENMENAADLKVKMTADLNTGKNWYDLK